MVVLIGQGSLENVFLRISISLVFRLLSIPFCEQRVGESFIVLDVWRVYESAAVSVHSESVDWLKTSYSCKYNRLYLVQVDLAIELLEDLLGIIQVDFFFAFVFLSALVFYVFEVRPLISYSFTSSMALFLLLRCP